MNTKKSNRRPQGMTLLEALVVLGILTVLASMLLPSLARAKCKCGTGSCVNNLKQIGTAFRIWAEDNGNVYPMEVSTNDGGSREYVSGPEVFRHFQAMANELGQSPMVVLCPADKERVAATNFINFDNSNLSYFVGVTVSATNANANLFLCGDRNLTNGTNPRRGLLRLATNDSVGWSMGIHGDKKNAAGNILCSDGRVLVFRTPELRQALKMPGVAPTSVAVP